MTKIDSYMLDGVLTLEETASNLISRIDDGEMMYFQFEKTGEADYTPLLVGYKVENDYRIYTGAGVFISETLDGQPAMQ